jgi:hypothetical protein
MIFQFSILNPVVPKKTAIFAKLNHSFINIFLINLSYNFRSSEKKPKLPASEFGEKEF